MSLYKLTYCPIECPEDIPTLEFFRISSIEKYIKEISSKSAVFVYWVDSTEEENIHNRHRNISISCDSRDVIGYVGLALWPEIHLNVFEFETYKDALEYCDSMWQGVTKYYDTESMVDDSNKQLNSQGAQPGQA